MAAKQISYDATARDHIRAGVQKLARAVKVTLGPRALLTAVEGLARADGDHDALLGLLLGEGGGATGHARDAAAVGVAVRGRGRRGSRARAVCPIYS